MKVQDLVVQLAKERGVDEVLVIYPSKIEVKEWVAQKACCREKRTARPLAIDRARSVLKEYYYAALIVGSKADGFSEILASIENELHKIGHYKAWAIHNEPLAIEFSRPCFEWFNIDIVATLRKYKKNLVTPQPGDYPPWGVLLLE